MLIDEPPTLTGGDADDTILKLDAFQRAKVNSDVILGIRASG
jgi:hypothetical protein